MLLKGTVVISGGGMIPLLQECGDVMINTSGRKDIKGYTYTIFVRNGGSPDAIGPFFTLGSLM